MGSWSFYQLWFWGEPATPSYAVSVGELSTDLAMATAPPRETFFVDLIRRGRIDSVFVSLNDGNGSKSKDLQVTNHMVSNLQMAMFPN